MFASLLDTAYALARPALFRLDPERAHALVLGMLGAATRSPGSVPVIRRLLGVDDPRASVEAFGLRFPNRIGLAPGLDKNALALNGWAALGFGHVEVGTVTPLAQPGNPRPRVFRLPADRALINRMGFPNDGASRIAERLARRPRSLPLIVGGNIGKGRATPLESAAEDYREAAATLAPYVDYLTVNVSSPNTPGLRQLQTPEQLARILVELRRLGRPMLVKLAPDIEWDALPDLVAATRQAGAAGLVAANTTTTRLGLLNHPSPAASEAGGLSGAPMTRQIVRLTAHLAELAADDLSIVSVGGIATAADVRERLAVGAQLVQLYTSLIYEGPALIARLLRPS